MDGNSLWLQDSVHVPDPLGNDDIEAELRILRGGKGAAAAAADKKDMPAPALGTQRSAIPPLRDLPSGSATASGGSGSSSTPTGMPRSSQPMSRGGRASIASADYYLQQRNQQLQDDMSQVQKQLGDVTEERDMLSKLLSSEKQTSDTWKSKYDHQVAREDTRMEQQLQKLRAVAEERDEALDAAQRAERDFATYRATIDAKIIKAEEDARRGLLEELDAAMTKISELELALADAQRAGGEVEQLRVTVDKLRETIAFGEEETRLAREELAAVRRTAEAESLDVDAAHRAALAAARDEHMEQLNDMQAQNAARVEELQRELGEQVSTARQRASQGEEARASLRRVEMELRDARDALESRDAEIDRLNQAAQQQRRTFDDQRASAIADLRREHEQVVASLIEEHNQDVARLKQRLSHGDAASERVARLEGALTAEKERVEQQQMDIDHLRREAEELRRNLSRRDEAVAEAAERAAEQEARADRVEDDMKARLSTERQSLHDRIQQLLTQIESLQRDHALEEESFAEQLAEARRRQGEAEGALGDMRSNATKERMSQMAAEQEARRELAAAIEARDEVAMEKRSLMVKLEAALADMNAYDRRLAAAETTLHQEQAAFGATRRELSEQRKDAVRWRERAEDLEARVRLVEVEAQRQQRVPSHRPPCSQHDPTDMPAPRMLPSPSPAPTNPHAALGELALGGMDQVGQRKLNYAANRHNGNPPLQSMPLMEPTPAPHSMVPAHALSPSNANVRHASHGKRHQSEDREMTSGERVFAATGFESAQEVLGPVTGLPAARAVEIPANQAPPAEVTHLVTSGQMTVKLLTALVRGCWVLPESYVRESAARGQWLPEGDFGFRHSRMLLKGRSFVFTDAFKKCRHFSTAKLVANEGGANVRAELIDNDARDLPQPVVLCTVQEQRAVRANFAQDTDVKVMTWDALVKLIHPPNSIRASGRA